MSPQETEYSERGGEQILQQLFAF